MPSESESESEPTTYRCPSFWNLTSNSHPWLTALLLLLFVASIVFFVTKVLHSPSDGTVCFPESDPVLWNGHSAAGYYFSTKTTYQRAHEAIQRTFDLAFPDLGLCKPIYLYYLGRHSIRYPNVKEIDKTRQVLTRMRTNLLAAGKLSSHTAHFLKNWKYVLFRGDNMNVTHAGDSQTRALGRVLLGPADINGSLIPILLSQTAEVFFKFFPNLMTIDRTQYEIKVSSKIRTSQTADAFIKGLIKVQQQNSLPQKAQGWCSLDVTFFLSTTHLLLLLSCRRQVSHCCLG